MRLRASSWVLSFAISRLNRFISTRVSIKFLVDGSKRIRKFKLTELVASLFVEFYERLWILLIEQVHTVGLFAEQNLLIN